MRAWCIGLAEWDESNWITHQVALAAKWDRLDPESRENILAHLITHCSDVELDNRDSEVAHCLLDQICQRQ